MMSCKYCNSINTIKLVKLNRGCCHAPEWWRRIELCYQRSWLGRMSPRYKNFYIVGFESGTVCPSDFREHRLLRWVPYFFGDEIKVEVAIKPKLTNIPATKISKIDVAYRLLRVGSGDMVFSNASTLTPNVFDQRKLSTHINLPPRLISLTQYILEINLSINNVVHVEWQPVCYFELHSGDKWILGFLLVLLPVVGAFVPQLASLIIEQLKLILGI